MRVLVVDDDQLILQFINSALSSEGYTVSTVGSVDEAFMELQNNDFDLVITDIVMPNHDGGTLMKYIRESDIDVPILAITAGLENAIDDYKFYADLFADHTLTKPFKKYTLLECVEELLGGKPATPKTASAHIEQTQI